MSTETQILVPPLRPFARQGRDYWRELRAIQKEIRYDLKHEAEARLRENGSTWSNKWWKPLDWCHLALRYRLNLKATAELIEEEGVLPTGSYERTMASRQMRPMSLLREYIEKYGLPEPAPGVEVGNG